MVNKGTAAAIVGVLGAILFVIGVIGFINPVSNMLYYKIAVGAGFVLLIACFLYLIRYSDSLNEKLTT
ncbi:hypothetical protein MsAg5_02990 [Methanosarcinaceae archaeon Ag5]|uniref:Uncharacterized protein n=1 Tax=Methanolapillus africanus TaxID=3028297 RepID=A0AAE4MH09_9EURY|nr:hypothetical protein [Methanosarcinaceae archaeon Ag5]